MSDMDPPNVVAAEEIEKTIQYFWENPDAIIDPIEKLMSGIEVGMRRATKMLKFEVKTQKSDGDANQEVAGSCVQDGVAAVAAESDEKAKLAIISRELGRVSVSFKGQLAKQNELISQLEQLQKSKAANKENKRKLADLKLQFEEMDKGSKRLLCELLRLDIELKRMLFDDTNAKRQKLREIHAKYSGSHKKDDTPEMVDLNKEFFEAMNVGQVSVEHTSEQDESCGIGIELRAHNKNIAGALRQIEELQADKMPSGKELDLAERLKRHYADPASVPNPIDADRERIAGTIRAFERDLAYMDIADDSDGARGGAAVEHPFEPNDQKRICSLKGELASASRAHKDLMRKQNALQKQIDEMDIDGDTIAKVKALKTQFDVLNPIGRNLKKNIGRLCIRVLRELHTAMGEMGKAEQMMRQQKNKMPVKGLRRTHEQKFDEFFMKSKMSTIHKLTNIAMGECGICEEIEKKSAVALTQIEMLERCATASVDDPDCRTM